MLSRSKVRFLSFFFFVPQFPTDFIDIDFKKAKELFDQVFMVQKEWLLFHDADLVVTEAQLFETNLKLEAWPTCLQFGGLLVEAYRSCSFPHPMLGSLKFLLNRFPAS